MGLIHIFSLLRQIDSLRLASTSMPCKITSEMEWLGRLKCWPTGVSSLWFCDHRSSCNHKLNVVFVTSISMISQGIAKAFSSAHQYVDILKKTLRITESALAWIHRRSPHVVEINVYIVEPDEKVRGQIFVIANYSFVCACEQCILTVKWCWN